MPSPSRPPPCGALASAHAQAAIDKPQKREWRASRGALLRQLHAGEVTSSDGAVAWGDLAPAVSVVAAMGGSYAKGEQVLASNKTPVSFSRSSKGETALSST